MKYLVQKNHYHFCLTIWWKFWTLDLPIVLAFSDSPSGASRTCSAGAPLATAHCLSFLKWVCFVCNRKWTYHHLIKSKTDGFLNSYTCHLFSPVHQNKNSVLLSCNNLKKTSAWNIQKASFEIYFIPILSILKFYMRRFLDDAWLRNMSQYRRQFSLARDAWYSFVRRFHHQESLQSCHPLTLNVLMLCRWVTTQESRLGPPYGGNA